MYKWGKHNLNSHKYNNNANDPPISSSAPRQPTKTDQHHNHPGAFQEHKISTLRRACFVVENKLTSHGKNPPPSSKRTLIEEFDLQDTLFFTPTKTEYSVLVPSKSKHGSAPSSPRLNPIRTHLVNNKKDESFEKTRPNSTRAQKIYSNLKNLKQPISPGGRLSTFISSFFARDGKKTKNKNKTEQFSNLSSSTCSLSKSCLSRSNSPTCSKKKDNFSNGVKRTVRFCPSVSVILDHHDHREKEKMQKQRQIEEVAFDLLNGYWDPKMSIKSHDQDVNDGTNYGEDEDNEDGLSCSSSDLFELDNLSLIRDELPVYETTLFHSTFL